MTSLKSKKDSDRNRKNKQISNVPNCKIGRENYQTKLCKNIQNRCKNMCNDVVWAVCDKKKPCPCCRSCVNNFLCVEIETQVFNKGFNRCYEKECANISKIYCEFCGIYKEDNEKHEPKIINLDLMSLYTEITDSLMYLSNVNRHLHGVTLTLSIDYRRNYKKKKIGKESTASTASNRSIDYHYPDVFKRVQSSQLQSQSNSVDEKLVDDDTPEYDTAGIGICFVLTEKKIEGVFMLEYALGLCYGAGIGDSIGSYFISSQGVINQGRLNDAMEMKGGGMRYGKEIRSGQVTDDTEMALCIARGLIRMIQERKNAEVQSVTMKYIADEYYIWWHSNPVDASSESMERAFKKKISIDEIRKIALEHNEKICKMFDPKGDASNGSLIRCMPLIIYESSLTHASYLIYYSVCAYALTAQYLIRHPEQRERNKLAVHYAEKFLSDCKSNTPQPKDSLVHKSAIEEVEKWIKQTRDVADKHIQKLSTQGLDPKKSFDHHLYPKLEEIRLFSSHIIISLQRAFYHLLKADEFEIAIKSTLGVGGNTDSNCCVVGGLLGAFHGITKLDKWRQKIDNSKVRSSRHIYQAKYYKDYVPYLFDNSLDPNNYKLEDNKISPYDNKKFAEFEL
ncbi:hypothetical protein RFI_16197 [Reticulomyxa filosa]|uniref:ADP-ribosylhydrolase ARH3 n=1 Tax=Reticulomyxa filosa TaxID=46433 RepID=X6N400_RETFI|nr:hypothetical protein RFI_16197 [Reticulomyxa filosa]|eukprot:ETO21005.1 hypothetical protein RFI_16197 [Reticulomyxa filosa]